MAADTHRLEAQVLTPEGSIFEGELFMLSTRTSVGEVGIRARHAPMIARLEPCELRLHDSDSGEPERYAQGEGWLEVYANRARVLVAEAIRPTELDVASLRSRLDEARQRAEEAEEGSADEAAAEREVARCEAFIAIAEGA
jgi:F-type H+-transporting ATPase subunit epsilon